ncbi:hypothetical protein [Lysinibacillus sp. G4S2]|uniref:hypothetical protein n=1 Tax=Lysinibacillus sp. G4S2 TaxID=3055859 RepID=UPI0025A25B07|nr:hypothetical protein [Lysinibacillus sp. G4S2]MDM5250308.1 hypothetical protein [Lysinibacillus sp. G4S2]
MTEKVNVSLDDFAFLKTFAEMYFLKNIAEIEQRISDYPTSNDEFMGKLENLLIKLKEQQQRAENIDCKYFY